MSQTPQLILASTSVYRRELLERLRIPFECARPDVDESARGGEAPEALALRLSQSKARAVASAFPGSLIIGSDQVATCGGERLDKPGTHAKAVEQLTRASGRTARFDTAVSVLDTRTNKIAGTVVPCLVHFRPLTAETIEAYLVRERPYDCAGSAKAEGLGIALIARIETSDPTSLVGLPLIALTDLLGDFGLNVI